MITALSSSTCRGHWRAPRSDPGDTQVRRVTWSAERSAWGRAGARRRQHPHTLTAQSQLASHVQTQSSYLMPPLLQHRATLPPLWAASCLPRGATRCSTWNQEATRGAIPHHRHQ
ncbi:hypothetical protein E2C01_048968 [Portunus trituberculatus]|uniref:Uncharacterized protein n=1 Tax=Portunus trituberculatus TaxID=210409 RepID=A0A5B7GCJ8_PORTR|nr:hypothetical protein [Portunus trituberculatus]